MTLRQHSTGTCPATRLLECYNPRYSTAWVCLDACVTGLTRDQGWGFYHPTPCECMQRKLLSTRNTLPRCRCSQGRAGARS